MKKIRNIFKVLLTFCVVILSSLFVLTACSGDVATPENARVTEELELSWFRVPDARTYDVSILCTKFTFTYPLSEEEIARFPIKEGEETIKSTRQITYNIENLPEGDYEFKVRAVPAGRSKKPSAWSPVIKYHKNYSTGCTYRLINSGTEYSVYKSLGAKGNVYIEDEYKGKPVTQIDRECFKNNQNVTNVYLGKNIKSIGASAFQWCKSLKTVTIPESVTYIGEQAFQNSSIESITIPDAVKEILTYTFQGCRSLKNVDLGNGLKSIGRNAFKNCDLIESIELPESLTSIGEGAFHICKGLKSITIPKNVTSIDTEAFYNNTALEEIAFEEGSKLKALPTGMLKGCSLLKGIVLPEGLQRIGVEAFYGCTELNSVNIPSTVVYIGGSAFYNTKIINESTEDIIYVDDWVVAVSKDAKTIDEENPDDKVLRGIASGSLLAGEASLKEGTKGIACGAFSSSEGLRRVVLPDSVEFLNPNAFRNCTSLTNLIIGGQDNSKSKLKEISSYAFANCAITNFNIRKSNIEYIADYAFYNNKNLINNPSYDIIPKSLKRMGAHVFTKTGLYNEVVEVTNEPVIYAGSWVVGVNPNVDITTVSIKEGTKGICDYAFSLCENLTEIKGMTGVTIIGKGAFYQCKSLVAITLNNSVTEIQPYTFYECQSLYSIKFPEDLAYIGQSAFYRCSSIDELDFSLTKVTSISNYSFYGCANLKNITFNPEITAINNYAFYKCSSLKEITIPSTIQTLGDRPFGYCTSLEKATIEMPLTKLPDRMFYRCTSLKDVSLPNTITEIGDYAFYECKNLEKLDLNENIIKIGNYAFYNNELLHDIVLPEKLTYIGRYAFKGALNLRSVYLSKDIEYVDQHAFYGAKNLTIYVEKDAKSADWHLRWNSMYRPVIYNCEFSEDNSYLVTVEIAQIDNIKGVGASATANTFSNPKRVGYTFNGWATAYGEPVTYKLADIVDLPKGTMLYACWVEGDEVIELIKPKPPIQEGEGDGTSSSGSSSVGSSDGASAGATGGLSIITDTDLNKNK